jgi:hypothetical protein
MKRIPRNWIPRTPAEAERLLWHVLEHLTVSRAPQDVHANTVIYSIIKQLQELQ